MTLSINRILLSLGMLVFVAALVAGATGAFFSDTETSTGNTFTAGDIDLQIDNESYIVSSSTGQLVAWEGTSWSLTDLTIEKFFDFIDLKPGDYGEDTISIHVGSNDAWLCASAAITEDSDNGFTEPEDEVFGTSSDNDDGTLDGDLDSELNFAFWVDDGDNVLENCVDTQVIDCVDETQQVFLSGTLSDMGQAGQIALADSNESILPDSGPIPGGTTFYIAKAWCFGDLGTPGVPQDGGDQGATPITAGSGVTCNGSGVGNIAQTDKVVGDITFYAEQARNNGGFQCQELPNPGDQT